MFSKIKDLDANLASEIGRVKEPLGVFLHLSLSLSLD